MGMGMGMAGTLAMFKHMPPPMGIHEGMRGVSTTSSNGAASVRRGSLVAGGASGSAGGGGGGGAPGDFLASLPRHAGAAVSCPVFRQHPDVSHALHALPSQPEHVHAELRELVAEQAVLLAEVTEEIANIEAAAISATNGNAGTALKSGADTAAVAQSLADAALSGSALPVSSSFTVASSSASPSSPSSPAPPSNAAAMAMAVPSPVVRLLMRQQGLLSRALGQMSSSLTSFYLLRDIYLSAAYAERRVRGQLSLDLSLALSRKKGLEATTEAILACLTSSLGAENGALYFVGQQDLFGLEPSPTALVNGGAGADPLRTRTGCT